MNKEDIEVGKDYKIKAPGVSGMGVYKVLKVYEDKNGNVLIEAKGKEAFARTFELNAVVEHKPEKTSGAQKIEVIKSTLVVDEPTIKIYHEEVASVPNYKRRGRPPKVIA